MRRAEYDRSRRWGRLKTFIGVFGAAFAVTLALVVGYRLSAGALGVLAGAVCGVAAAIPTSVIVVAVTRRRDGSQPAHYRNVPQQGLNDGSYSPVIVVSPHGAHQGGYFTGYGAPPSLSAPIERDFRVVGGAAIDGEGM